ncbi:MAG: hypothetical protein HY690_19875, partial [Chloroflexi bacterium]|nr:hypothetical protein [Chloroflexota bacterium]
MGKQRPDPPQEVLAALDLAQVPEGPVRQAVLVLLNLVEDLQREVLELRAEHQRLRDELNRLKGEQGKPEVKGNTPKPPPRDYSSEPERRTPQAWSKGAKRASLRIEREERLELDRATLPADAEFKGYEDVVVQDLVVRSETIRFRKAKWYSPSEH